MSVFPAALPPRGLIATRGPSLRRLSPTRSGPPDQVLSGNVHVEVAVGPLGTRARRCPPAARIRSTRKARAPPRRRHQAIRYHSARVPANATGSTSRYRHPGRAGPGRSMQQDVPRGDRFLDGQRDGGGGRRAPPPCGPLPGGQFPGGLFLVSRLLARPLLVLRARGRWCPRRLPRGGRCRSAGPGPSARLPGPSARPRRWPGPCAARCGWPRRTACSSSRASDTAIATISAAVKFSGGRVSVLSIALAAPAGLGVDRHPGFLQGQDVPLDGRVY